MGKKKHMGGCDRSQDTEVSKCFEGSEEGAGFEHCLTNQTAWQPGSTGLFSLPEDIWQGLKTLVFGCPR